MVDVVKCRKGHFYDKNAYKECPHCASGWLDCINTMEYRNQISALAQQYLETFQTENQPSIRTNIDSVYSKGNTAQKEKINADSPELVSDNDKTMSFAADSQNNYLVTGWIVCIDGPDTGYSFNLHHGYNSVGCSHKCEICLSESSCVAKKVHCSLVYEGRKNRFYLVPEKEYQTYVNGNCLAEIKEILSEDTICIGKDSFVFIAFCKAQRRWDVKKV